MCKERAITPLWGSAAADSAMFDLFGSCAEARGAPPHSHHLDAIANHTLSSSLSRLRLDNSLPR